MQSHDVIGSNIEKIAKLFQNCVTEVLDNQTGGVKLGIDFEKLKAELSLDIIDETEERYQFTWPDKRAAVRLANTPTTMTLRPCREESVDFDNTQNLYIEGDNLDILKVLRETYLGKVKMIYIDPPYNTGNDFVYNDDFAQGKDDFEQSSGLFDEEGNQTIDPMQRNTESNGRFHTDWLNMIYPRLKVARDLLTDDGVIFISIDDNEVENLKKVCDEIFGECNFCGCFVINSTPNARDYGHIGKMHEYCLFYAKNKEQTTTNMLPDNNKSFKYQDSKGGYNIHPLYNSNESFTNLNRPNLYYPFYVYTDKKISDCFYEIGLEPLNEYSVQVYPPKSLKNSVQFVWRWGKEKSLNNINQEIIGYEVSAGDYRIVQKMRHDEKIIRSLLLDNKYSSRKGTAEVEDIFGFKCFSFPKPLSLLSDLVKIGVMENDIVLDFFSGSATTAHAVMQLNAEDGGNRKFIMVQLPEKTDEKSEAYKAGYKNICEIGKERIRRAGKKVKEEAGLSAKNLDIGFRILKLDSSNMEDVYYTPQEFELQSLFNENVKADRTNEDLLFQVMLDLGIELSAKIESKQITGKNVHFVDDNYLVACFDRDVNESTITEIAKLQPIYFVMRDASAANDNVIDNFEQIFKHYSPDTNCRII